MTQNTTCLCRRQIITHSGKKESYNTVISENCLARYLMKTPPFLLPNVGNLMFLKLSSNFGGAAINQSRSLKEKNSIVQMDSEQSRPSDCIYL